MAVPKLSDMWRVLKDADLPRIRRDSERPFRILVVAEDVGDAQRLAALLTGEEEGREFHPWLRPVAAVEGIPSADSGYDAALILANSPDPDGGLSVSLDTLRAARTPVVSVVRGTTRGTDAVVRPGEAARAVIPNLGAWHIPAVAQALVSAVDPPRRRAFARHLPPLRPAVFAELIDETAQANAVYTLTTGLAESVPVLSAPLNLADMVVLTKNQLVMSYKIALAAGKKGTARDLIGEVLGVIGGGFLFRQGARQLVGLIPVAGVVPKVAVAYAGTVAIGRAVAAWATEGRRLSASAVRGFYREAWGQGKRVAEALVAQARRASRRPRWLRLPGRKRSS